MGCGLGGCAGGGGGALELLSLTEMLRELGTGGWYLYWQRWVL